MSSTPEAPLQFDCPACGAVLTVPASIAGMQGPCPKCWQEIISPDPAIGLPARLPAPPQPFAAPAPAPVPEPIPAPAPEPLPAPVVPAPEPLPALGSVLPAPPLEPKPAPAPVAAASPEPPPAPSPVLPAPPLRPEPVPAPVDGTIPGAPPVPAPALTTSFRDEKISSIGDQPDERTPTHAPRKRSKAPLVLAIGIPALALAGVGYYFGKDHLPPIYKSPALGVSSHQPPAPAPSPAPAPEPAPAPTPDETGQGLRPPPAPLPSEANDAQEALIAFLGAPDWQARSAFVLSPDEVRPAMEKHAKENGDGPIPASTIHLDADQSQPTVFVFKVCTKAMPDGFPVPVMLTDEGPKIDWESFIAFNDDHFRKLLVGPPDQSGILNVLVKPEVGAEPSPHWVRYRLSVPMPGREATAWVRKDSVALAQLRSVFNGENGVAKDTVDQFVASAGMPLRLSITKRRTNDGREFIEVQDMVAVWWAPPKQP